MCNTSIPIRMEVSICSLERFLSRHGFDVEAAYIGKTALDMVSQKAYDLVFCDFRLKDMEERDFIEKSRLIVLLFLPVWNILAL